MKLRAALPALLPFFIAAFSACEAPKAAGPLATGQTDVEAMVSDDFYLYWVVASGQVRRVSLDGGAVEDLASGAPGPASIALDEENVYWTSGDGSIERVAKTGGEPTIVAVHAGASSIAVDDQNVYFTASQYVMSVPKSGSMAAATTLASGEVNPRSLHIAAGLVWVSDGSGTTAAPAIRELPVSGGMVTNLLDGISPIKIALAPSHIAWTEAATGSVRVATLDGSEVREVARVDAGQSLDDVFVDETNVYFTTNAGAFEVVPLAPGSTPTLAMQGPAGSVKLAGDRYYVYSANTTDGSIVQHMK